MGGGDERPGQVVEQDGGAVGHEDAQGGAGQVGDEGIALGDGAGGRARPVEQLTGHVDDVGAMHLVGEHERHADGLLDGRPVGADRVEVVADVGAEVEPGEGSHAHPVVAVGEGSHEPRRVISPGEHACNLSPGHPGTTQGPDRIGRGPAGASAQLT